MCLVFHVKLQSLIGYHSPIERRWLCVSCFWHNCRRHVSCEGFLTAVYRGQFVDCLRAVWNVVNFTTESLAPAALQIHAEKLPRAVPVKYVNVTVEQTRNYREFSRTKTLNQKCSLISVFFADIFDSSQLPWKTYRKCDRENSSPSVTSKTCSASVPDISRKFENCGYSKCFENIREPKNFVGSEVLALLP